MSAFAGYHGDHARVDTIAQLIGQRVRKYRQDSMPPLCRKELATAARVSRQSIAQIENGHRMPSMVAVYRLAKALDVEASDLLPREAQIQQAMP